MKKMSLRSVCQCALLVALEVVLNRFCSIQTPFLKIGVSFIAVVMGAMAYGPVGGAVVGGLGDMIGALLFPFGPYHPGFSLCGAAIGAVYGFYLFIGSGHFENRLHLRFFPNVVVSVLINCVVFSLLINTLWISQLYDENSYMGYLISRVPQEIGLGAVRLFVIPLIAPIARRLHSMGLVG